MRAIRICSVLLAVLLARTMAGSKKDNAESVINANIKLTSTMYDLLKETPGNVFYSSIGVHTALSALHQGAEGETLAALSSTLNLPDKASSADGFEKITRNLNNVDDLKLEISNKLYIKTGCSFKPAFKDVAEKNFNVEIESIDFAENEAAAQTINTWAEKKTHNKIKDLISADDLNNHTRSVIVNAVYFKSDWLFKFNKHQTWRDPFTSADGSYFEVDTMHLTNRIDWNYDPHLRAMIIRLPCANEKFSMLFVLPNEILDLKGITELENEVVNYNLTELTHEMRKIWIFLALPRFKIEMKMDLKEPLKKAGLSNIFSKKADLSGLLDSSEPLYVNKVLQTAFIEVNEEGREEAPIHKPTKESIRHGMMTMIFERPFIFALMRKRNILFYGKMTSFDPQYPPSV